VTITFFSVPKPFVGHVGVIQRNALASWSRLGGVIVFGDEPGVAEAARDAGARHVPDVAQNDYGTPLLSDAFRRAEELSDADTFCFVNADILLFDDIPSAARRLAPPYLLVGESWNAVVTEPLSFEVGWEEAVRSLPLQKRGADAIDYFVYSRGLYDGMPPFAVGRTAFDNWLIWKARDRRATVVDATGAVKTIHQAHDYSHGGSLAQIRVSPEAVQNRELAGGKQRLYSRFDATHRLIGRRLLPNPLRAGRVGERARRGLYKLRHRVLRMRVE
jgi:hypothetical protein